MNSKYKEIIRNSYQFLIILAYLTVGVYLIYKEKNFQGSELESIMGFVILVYGLYRAYRFFTFFKKSEEN